MRSPARLAVLGGSLVLAVGGLVYWWPFLTGERTFVASIPQPAPLFSRPEVPLRAGDQLCFSPAVMDTHSQRAAFVVDTGKAPPQPVRLTINGPGYQFAVSATGGAPGGAAVVVPVRAPNRDLPIRACVENAGRRAVSLWGVDDRTRTPLIVTSAGQRIGPGVQFAFYEARPASIARHLPIALQRMSAFRPGFLGPWLFWPLALICALGIPVGALWALWRSIGDDAADDEIAEPVPTDAARAERARLSELGGVPEPKASRS
jgi:hypothetical protein